MTYWTVVVASFVVGLVKNQRSLLSQLLLHALIGVSFSALLFVAGFMAMNDQALSESENFAGSIGFGFSLALVMVLINRLIRFGYATLLGRSQLLS